MDAIFTKALQAWLDTEPSERDLQQGALYLLQLNGNTIMYRNNLVNIQAKAAFIEMQIRKYMAFRLADVTHSEVAAMAAQVEKIAASHALNTADASKTASAEFRAGKRPDHDTLPAEIQALYVENATLMQKMRELHLQLRNLSTANTTCPDSDRYPFLKELIALDKQYHKNWHVYDSWSADAVDAEQRLVEDERQRQKNLYRRINLTKGRYKRSPSEGLKEQILELYKEITAPTETLTEELTALGILPSCSTPKAE